MKNSGKAYNVLNPQRKVRIYRTKGQYWQTNNQGPKDKHGNYK